MANGKHEKILREAQKYKQKMMPTVPKITPKHDVIKPVTPSDDERKEVWEALYGSSPAIVWYLPFAFPVIVYLFYAGGKITLTEWLLTFVLAGIPLLMRILFVRIYLATGFRSFRHWRQKLPFTLSGWEQVVDSKILQDDCTWARHFTFEVGYNGKSAEDAGNLKAYLTVLEKKVNACFYKPESIIDGYSGDPREPFKIDKYTLTGSANRKVIGVMHRFLRDNFTGLQERSPIISNVSLTFGTEMMSVFPAPLETDSPGG
jgi:hypothetical protein